jgi:hypothetical protein
VSFGDDNSDSLAHADLEKEIFVFKVFWNNKIDR